MTWPAPGETEAGLYVPTAISDGIVPFRCFGCGGEAQYAPRGRRWSCRDGCGANGDSWELLARLGAPAAGRTASKGVGPTVPTGITADALMRRVFPDPRWAIPGAVPEGATLFVGAPKKGKSWFLLGCSVAVAAGGVALGSIPVEGGDVLCLALEDNERRLQERLGIILDGEPAPDRLHLYTRWPSLAEGGAEHLDAWLRGHPDTRLVGIDVVARLRTQTSSSANLYAADYATMSQLKAVADAHRVALVAVHHTRKADAEDPLDLVSGTTGLAGAADTILVLTRAKGRADATLYIRGRDVPEADHALGFDPVTCRWSLLGDAAEYRMSEERAAIVGALRDAGAEMTPKQLADLLGKKGEAVRFLIRKMAQAGEVVGVGGHYRLPPNTANTPHSANAPHPAHPAHTSATGASVSGGVVAANGRLPLGAAENGPPLAGLAVLAGGRP